MNYKRITLLCGHYGSGKTNVALNMAYELKNMKKEVCIADLDIVNPYFRTKDSAKELEEKGIKLICSEYAGSNVDIPALPQDMYYLTDNKESFAVIDVGGDDRGALALGRIAPAIVEEGNYECLLVINMYRPLTPDAVSTLEVMKEIEAASKIKFTGIVNNSNIGSQTTARDVKKSFKFADEVSKLSGLPIVVTSVDKRLYDSFKTEDNILPLKLQEKIF